MSDDFSSLPPASNNPYAAPTMAAGKPAPPSNRRDGLILGLGIGAIGTTVIGAMLGQGLSPWEAARVGVVAHASAGDLAAEQHGQRGLLASDISAFLPLVLNPV